MNKRETQKKYRQTDAYKASMKKYHGSEKGRKAKAAADKRYKESEKGKQAIKISRKLSRAKGEFDLTREVLESLYERSGGNCEICGIAEKELSRALAVDHCHDKKKVRGLLCTKCNMGLGYFEDNLDLLASASSYLINNV